jgi:hypothetical protein
MRLTAALELERYRYEVETLLQGGTAGQHFLCHLSRLPSPNPALGSPVSHLPCLAAHQPGGFDQLFQPKRLGESGEPPVLLRRVGAYGEHGQLGAEDREHLRQLPPVYPRHSEIGNHQIQPAGPLLDQAESLFPVPGLHHGSTVRLESAAAYLANSGIVLDQEYGGTTIPAHGQGRLGVRPLLCQEHGTCADWDGELPRIWRAV